MQRIAGEMTWKNWQLVNWQTTVFGIILEKYYRQNYFPQHQAAGYSHSEKCQMC
ncbi:hypothetical protein [Anabaena sp. UHCC 0253]|uniref:hypothetical protein n=1 Tax=Anabaena sp. UHCC 0253 TaxID=2590019 RepID=UPI001445D593|nr:hypothetical protein [Anabaena sp. UHCC 0253]